MVTPGAGLDMTATTDQFAFHFPTRLVFGRGVVEQVGALAREIGGRTVLLVTDPGLVAAGHADRVRGLLTSAGLACGVFDDVHENPSTADVDRCVAVARDLDPDLIVALGGGSSMDAAKGCNFLLTNGGRMQDYRGRGKATQPMLPFIAIPTTAGTGSEVQSYALVSDEATHQKMACGDPKALARVAVIDPTLATSQPRLVIACTGLDAIAHAVETAVTANRNAVSRLFARESFRLARAAFPRVLASPDDLDAQGDMMLAAAFGGTAIENSMLGAAHSMANPLTAQFGIVHGQAVGMTLPHVVRFNAEDDAARAEYAQLAASAGLVDDGVDPVTVLLDCLRRLYAATELPVSLGECDVPRTAVASLAEGAAEQWTAQFNPRAVTAGDFEGLYSAAFE